MGSWQIKKNNRVLEKTTQYMCTVADKTVNINLCDLPPRPRYFIIL